MTKKKPPAEPTFEELLEQTEAAVDKLESGELSLEEAMAEYEKGVRNLARCSGYIREAQQKVQQLIEDKEGELRLADFDAGELEDELDEDNED